MAYNRLDLSGLMASQQPQASVWASRFIVGAIVMGAIAFVIFGAMLVLQLTGAPVARALAAGGISVWLLIGMVGLLIACVATATTALFYQHIEVTLGKPMTGYWTIFAWLHLTLMTVGALVASIMLIYVGYTGGVGAVEVQYGGGGLNPGQVHEIAAPYPVPIGYALGVTSLGVLIGGIGYVASWLLKR